ncbi:MinD/ParA family protein [Nocardioides guangzhouensis]|uniref:MinD/ParA family protein n=1 Tax=Nocardioides guangzhouensis TaxID=2497878 RepID=A0A4Q4ZCH4_9ACTN|nr:AAA family ATPase [Nocardioides guangzhouensis]RYP85672.1 MinD/ParA family protein [Nocardioides guangzhouensis]
MPVIIEPDPGSIEALAPFLPAGSHGINSADKLDSWLAHRTDEYAVVIGPNVSLDEAITISEGLRYTRPSTSVILVRDGFDTDVLYRAMQAGCRDVVRLEDEEGIRDAVQRAHQLWLALHGGSGTGKTGHVVTVFSPKGGVGKTTTAVNLALALGDGGSRKVCLVDLDLAFGDVAITMQLFPAHTIEEMIGAEDLLDYSMVEGLLTRHEDSLMILAAPAGPDARDRVSATLIARVLRTLGQEFDYVVVDTCPSFDELTLQALDETDECIILATLDVPTLKNVKVALETLDLLNIAVDHRHLVLNRADDAVGLDDAKVEQILSMPVSVPIPTSTDIAAATNAGTPIIVSQPNHAASRAFKELAQRLSSEVGDSHLAELVEPTEDDSRNRGRRLRLRR